MRCRLALLALCMLPGAVVNILVAWSCAAWSEARLAGPHASFPDAEQARSIVESNGLVYEPSRPWRVSGFGAHWALIDASLVKDDGSIGLVQVLHVQAGWPAKSLQGGGVALHAGVAYKWDSAYDGVALPYSTAGPAPYWRALSTGDLLSTTMDLRRVLPGRPMWTGFAANSVFWCATLWILLQGLHAILGRWRRARGRCPDCAYPIGSSPRCSECGRHLVARRRSTVLPSRLSASVAKPRMRTASA